MEFMAYPPEKVKIVGYAAKWHATSFEYQHTCRRFAFPREDAALLARLKELAYRCWQHFALRGYARIDFRVDEAGVPWVLEVNANPCLAPDSGFLAAAQQAGYTTVQVVQRILADVADMPPRALPRDGTAGAVRMSDG
jgi:D-alanine-D-alanine ligase